MTAKEPTKRKGISTAARKQKGRNLQKRVVKEILDRFDLILEDDDVRSCSMGANGADIILSPLARKALHCAFECKNQEKFKPLTESFNQAKCHAKEGDVPVLVIKTNHDEPYAVVDLGAFLDILHMLYFYNRDWNMLIGKD